MFENISVKNALKLAYEGRAVLFDIREEEEYKIGHLPMAEHVPEEILVSRVKEERRKKDISQFGDGIQNQMQKKIILYCAFGNQSMRLAKELSEAGYKNIASIVGGYHAYEGYVEAQKNQFWTMEWKSRGWPGTV